MLKFLIFVKPLDRKIWFQSHIVEQHKSYRMVIESWESIHGDQNVLPLHKELFFQALANSMHKTVQCGAHRCLWLMGLEQEEIRRVAIF